MFRPLLRPALWFIPMFAVLIALGTWQIQRLHWKEALIARMHTHLSSKPVTLDQILRLPAQQAEYRRVTLEGRFIHAKEAYVFSTGPRGTAVYHVLTPLVMEDGRALIVDRGIVPEDLRDPRLRLAGQLKGIRHLTGVWRTPDPPNLFTPRPSLAKRIWYARDVKDMARVDGLTLAAPVIVEADATPNPGSWPKGGQTVVDLPNNHLQYAITWYLMALGLLAVYLVYHYQKGRFGWRP